MKKREPKRPDTEPWELVITETEKNWFHGEMRLPSPHGWWRLYAFSREDLIQSARDRKKRYYFEQTTEVVKI